MTDDHNILTGHRSDDEKVLYAVETLHLDLLKSGIGEIREKARHIERFITFSKLDVAPPTLEKLSRYRTTVVGHVTRPITTDSIAHLETVAKECFTKLNEAAEELR